MINEKATAEKLLQINAIKLSPQQPFTWASGWKSPIYCDNRKVLSFPFSRDFIKSEMCNVVFEKFPEADLLAGVGTAGIPWGAMVADQLKLPYIYVRPKPKEHGMGNQIEGVYEKGAFPIYGWRERQTHDELIYHLPHLSAVGFDCRGRRPIVVLIVDVVPAHLIDTHGKHGFKLRVHALAD
jgi:hypothetical protein